MFCDLRNFTAMSEQLKPQEDQVQRAVQASFEMYRKLGELMFELGDYAEEEHRKLGELASHYGKEAANAIALFRELAHKYPDQTYYKAMPDKLLQV